MRPFSAIPASAPGAPASDEPARDGIVDKLEISLRNESGDRISRKRHFYTAGEHLLSLGELTNAGTLEFVGSNQRIR